MKIIVLLFVCLGILSILPFFVGRHLVGGVASALTLGSLGFVLILPRLPVPEITKRDFIWAICIALLAALLFSFNPSYDKMVEWSTVKSAAWVLLAIALRPVGKNAVEALLDRIYGNSRLKMLERTTGKTVWQAPELRQFAQYGALAEGLYSAIVTGFALMNVLHEVVSDRTGQQVLIIAAMTICSLAVFWWHPHERTLRRYLSEEQRTGYAPLDCDSF